MGIKFKPTPEDFCSYCKGKEDLKFDKYGMPKRTFVCAPCFKKIEDRFQRDMKVGRRQVLGFGRNG